MNERSKTCLVATAVTTGTVPLAAMSAWMTLIIIQARQHPELSAGGNAISLMMMSLSSYAFALLLLVPSICYLACRMLRARGAVPAVHRWLLAVALLVLAAPPLMLQALPYLARR